MGPNTSAAGSCAARLNGEMFVFGGYREEKQVRRIFHDNRVPVQFSQHLKFRLVKLKTVACNGLVIYYTNLWMVPVERLYLKLKKELCFVSQR